MDKMLTYKSVAEMFTNLEDSNFIQISNVMVFVKVIALIFIIINLIKIYLDSLGNEQAFKINWNKIIWTFVYVAFLFNYNVIIDKSEIILGEFENTIQLENSDKMYSLLEDNYMQTEFNKAKSEDDNSWISDVLLQINIALKKIANLFDPMNLILMLIKAIAWLIDACIYPVFLIERGFLLLCCKLIAPFVFALATLEKYRDLAFKWFRVFAAIYLSGIFLMLVCAVCNGLQVQLVKLFNGGDTYKWALTSTAGIMAICILSLAKGKLLGSAVNFSNKIFNA